MPTGSFSADAILKKTQNESTQTFVSDDFNRSVGPGTGSLGGPWVWSEDDSWVDDAADDNVYVDGTAVVLPAHPDSAPASANYSSWRFGDRPESGTVTFDFWVPTLAGQSGSHPTYGVNLDSDTNPVFIYVWPDSPGDWLLGPGQWDTSANVPDVSFTPDASSWYRAEMVFDALQNVEMRVWKVGDTRPSSPMTSGQMNDVGAPSNNGIPFLDLYYAAINDEDAKLDNFVLTGGGPLAFSADAVIKKTITSRTLLSDDFNRVVPEWDGWGNGWVISDGDFAAVDGAHGLSKEHQWFNATHPNIPEFLGDFDLYFDFQAEPIGDGSQNWSLYIYAQYGSSWFDVFPDSDPVSSPYDMYVEVNDSDGDLYSVVAEAWYSIHFQQSNGLNQVKIWPQGDPEPEDWFQSAPVNGLDDSLFEVDGGFSTPTYVDNFLLTSASTFPLDAVFSPRHFSADAIIKRPQGGGSTTAPTYQASTVATGQTSVFTSPLPTGTVEGDILVEFISSNSADATRVWEPYVTTGVWRHVASYMAPDGSYSQDAFVHVVTAATIANGYTYFIASPTSGTPSTTSALLRISGSTAGSLDRIVGGASGSTSSSTSHPTDYIDSVAGLLIVGAGGSAATWTPPSGMTERTDNTYISASLETSTVAATSGDIGIKTATSSASSPTTMTWVVLPAPALTFQVFAVLKAKVFTADAVIAYRRFTASAWIQRTVGGGSMTAPVWVSGGGTGSTTSGTIGCAVSGRARGDVLVAFISYDALGNTAQGWTSNQGWTRIAHSVLSNGDQGLDVFVHLITDLSSEPGTYVWTAAFGGTFDSIMTIARVTGANDAVITTGSTLNTTYVTSHSTENIATNVGLLLLAASGAQTGTWTPASGMTERADTSNGFSSIEYATQTITNGNIGVKTVTSSVVQPDLLTWLVLTPTNARYFTVFAVLAQRNFTADAVKKRTQTGSTTANAVIAALNFRANAVIKGTRTGSTIARAVIKKTGQTGTFTADSQIARAFFRVFAVIKALDRTGSFTANAVRKRTGLTGSFTADGHFAYSFSGTFTASALLMAAGSGGSFTVDYATWSGVGPPPPILGVPSRIFVNGVEITTHVMWKTASFSAKVNSQSGECSFTVVDRAHDLTFEFGDEIQLYIDGILRWGGWVLQVGRKFPFPVMKSPATEARLYQITGVDYTRFLDRRVLHDSSNPGRTWNYPAGTADNTIFNNIWPYFDTAGFTKNIQHVADGVLDIPGVTARTGGNVAQGGFSMRDVLLHLSWDTGAIFYVTPDKVVTYVDADLVSNPYTLTDTPSIPPLPLDVGYHDVRVIEDSTEMVNDAIVWGAGKGSNQVVVARNQSSASQTDHGRWQAGNFTQGIYKQATANAVASARVNGSPESLRGAKDPKRAVELLTWEPVFGVGDVVSFYNGQFDYTDVLPIRSMTITWPTPYHPLFNLQLSWEIDAVWSFFDPWLPVGAPGLGGGGTGPGGLPPGGQDPPPGCTGCGITDSFDGRTTVPYDGSYYTGNNWGLSDLGVLWNGSAVASWVGDNAGHLVIYNPPFPPYVEDFDYVWGQQAYLNWGFDPPGALDVTVELLLNRALATDDTGHGGDPDYWGEYFWMFYGDGPPYGAGKFVVEFTGHSGAQVVLWDGTGESGWTSFAGLDMTERFKIRVICAGENEPIDVYWWNSAGSQTASPQISMPTVGTGQGFSNHGFTVELATNNDAITTALEFQMGSIDAVGVTRCGAPQFDNFNRSVTDGWGAATPSGYEWSTDASNPDAYLVTPGYGQYNPALSPGFDGLIYVSPPPAVTGLDVLIRFSVNNTSGDNEAEPQFYIANKDPIDSGDFDDYHGPDIFFFESDPISFSMVQRGPNHPGDVDYLEISGAWLGVLWNLHYTINGGRVEASLWRQGETEPSAFMIQGGDENYAFAVPQDAFYFFDPNVGQTVRIYSIDFGYAGKPCYYVCGPGEAVIFDSFLDRTLVGSLGNTSSDGRPWITDFATGLTDYGTNFSALSGGFVRNNGASFAGQAYFYVEPRPGDTWTTGSYFHFQITVRCANVPNTRFFVELSGDNCFIRWDMYFGATGGLIDVDDVGNAWNASLPKTDWVNNTDYILEGYADEYRGAGVRVYEEGGTPTAWTEFTYGDGSHTGMDGTTTLAVAPFFIPSPILVFWKNLTFLSSCVGQDESVGNDMPVGTSLTEDLDPLGTATGAPPTYPANSEWQATNSILPGSAVLRVGGSIQYGNWIVLDADQGTIRITSTVLATSTVELTYITNGALP